MGKIGRSSTASATAVACLVLVIVLLFSATGAAASVAEEKRSCQSQSHKFKGKCLSDTNCGSVCETEGFSGGKCRGFRQRCFCTRNC
ncbi:Scorpion toxin-like knottin superfamily protein [Perilla frutescens var. frutescens]|nr:Scorpion toxin-like knottin superfamily protein [Perilla frutescens var. frutescens]